jgi:hypothetical protein
MAEVLAGMSSRAGTTVITFINRMAWLARTLSNMTRKEKHVWRADVAIPSVLSITTVFGFPLMASQSASIFAVAGFTNIAG